MPIYEFFSPETNTVYSFFSHGVLEPGSVPRCPDGDTFSMRRMVSGFAVVGSARELPESGLPDEEDKRMEAAMEQMDREMAGMDEENPDPREMGRMMRRMSELTGEKMPESMKEMIGRLEAGEDPDALEEDFAEALESEDFDGDDSGEAADPGRGHGKKRAPRLKGPVRDQQLYELRDYI